MGANLCFPTRFPIIPIFTPWRLNKSARTSSFLEAQYLLQHTDKDTYNITMPERLPFQMTITMGDVNRTLDRLIYHAPRYIPRTKRMYAVSRQAKYQEDQHEQVEPLTCRHLGSNTSDVKISASWAVFQS